MNETETLAKNFASHLCSIHGEGKMHTSEKFGPILNIPCPDCLAKYGLRELKSKHLGVRIKETLENKKGNVATCMKCNSKFTRKELLGMPTVKIRFPLLKIRTNLQLVTYKPPQLYPNELGVLVPHPPGTIVSLRDLPKEHPAVWYLENRGHNIEHLCKKFDTGYCTEELPENSETNVYYKRLANNWKDTPQGRIVFKAMERGSIVNWQGRLIEAETSDGQVVFVNPYTHEWQVCGKKVEGKTEWNEEFMVDGKKRWPPSKYKNAAGANALQHIFGLEFFVETWKPVPREQRFAVVTEGTLDADRFGFTGLPLTGKNMSSTQAYLIKQHCDTCIIAADNDDVGQKAIEDIGEVAAAAGLNVLSVNPPKDKKDFGDCHPKDCIKMVMSVLPSSYKINQKMFTHL